VKNKTMKRFLWKFIVLLSLLPLYGCVGVGIIGSTGTEYNHYRYDRLSSERGELNQGAATGNITKDQVLSTWGEPDQISTIDENHIKWVYHRELAWHGMFVFVVVPIPLVAPFGSRNTEVILEGDAVTGILYHTTDLAPRCLVSLFGISHPGLTLGGVDCSFEKTPWKIYGDRRH